MISKIENLRQKFTLVYLVLIIIPIQIICQENVIKNQIKIGVGNKAYELRHYKEDPCGLTIGGMDIDKYGNIFIADLGDSSIKKFNTQGKYLERIKVPNIRFLNIICFEDKIYCIDRENSKNDLYIFDILSLKNVKIKDHIFSEHMWISTSESYNHYIVFDMLKYGYHVYDMKLDTIYKSLKNPFDIYKNLDVEIIEFLKEKADPITTTSYLGMLDNWLVFLKAPLNEPILEVALINYIGNEILTTSIDSDLLGEQVGTNHIRLKNNGVLYFLGYRENCVIVSKIDLIHLFADKLKYIKNKESKNIYKLSPKELLLKRNEIFARHGRTFKTEWIQEYFNKQPWYKPNPNYSDSLLIEEEIELIKLIKQIEKEKEDLIENNLDK